VLTSVRIISLITVQNGLSTVQVLTLLISSVILHVEQDKSNTPGNLPGEFCTHMFDIWHSGKSIP